MGWPAISLRGPLIRRKRQTGSSKTTGEAGAVEETSRLDLAERSDGNMQQEVGLDPTVQGEEQLAGIN